MANVGAVIAKIREQGKGYKAHGNEWNVMNQLIDLVAVDAAGAELVEKDLDMPEMAVDKLVKKITRARLADPVKVMEEICKFYVRGKRWYPLWSCWGASSDESDG